MTDHPAKQPTRAEGASSHAAAASFILTIDGRPVEVTSDQTVLSAARALGIDIPTLCYLEKCGPLNSCLVCLVRVNGKLVPSCGTKVQPGMVVESETEEVHQARRTALELLFSDHVGDCLAPCQRLCPLGLNIPSMLRQIRSGQNEDALQHLRGTLPLAGILGRLCHHPCEQGCRRGTWDDPAAIRDLERSLTDFEVQSGGQFTLSGKPATGKSVVIVGAGPCGLAAAYYLVRRGHAVTLADRNVLAGGSLRRVAEADLPNGILHAEISRMARLGVELKLGVQLGADIRLDGLARGFDAILLTTGESTAGQANHLGLANAGATLKTDPNTCLTSMPKVFAAGSAVKPVKQLVRVMAEGRAAAECVHNFLNGEAPRRPEKRFSSIMGRLERGELKEFLRSANMSASVTPCDRCAGFNRQEAALESSRCLHCDCRSSGDCLLQHYAQVYSVDASRFRAERKSFSQIRQPGGVIFEPGKCILCGICVKLTELAREPLGLTFIGRGFDVRLAAPFGHTIEEGLQRTARECVENCPTGALALEKEVALEPNRANS